MMKLPQKRQIAREFLRFGLRQSEHTFPAILASLLDGAGDHFPKRAKQAIQAGKELKAEILEKLHPQGVMLFPSYVQTAPKHNWPLLKLFHWVYTGIINVLELPATQVPLGLNKAGMPLGIQVIGLPYQDHVTIGVAQHLEEDFGGWVFPAWKQCS